MAPTTTKIRKSTVNWDQIIQPLMLLVVGCCGGMGGVGESS